MERESPAEREKLERDCAAIFVSGSKVAAIKKWRAATGDSLKVAMETVERLARKK